MPPSHTDQQMNPRSSKHTCFAVQDTLVHGHGGTLHAIAWHPTRTSTFATAAESPRVLVFDAAQRNILKAAAVGCSLRACAWSTVPLRDDEFHHLALGATNGKLIVLDEERLQPLWDARDCQAAITDLRYSPDGSMLAAANAERHIELYSVGLQRYTRAARCVGHSALVRHVDWSRDGTTLQSNCSAYETLHWNGRNGKQVTATQRDTSWHTWTCALGFTVMGIWPADADGTDINSLDRDSEGALVATGDDRGTVKLFNYPCVVADAPHRAYSGHSLHVMCVRFSAESAWLASAGGADRSVMQFRIAQVQPPPPPPPPLRQPFWGTVDGKVFGWTRDPNAQPAEGAAAVKVDQTAEGNGCLAPAEAHGLEELERDGLGEDERARTGGW